MLRTQWHGRPGPFLQRVTHLLKKIAGQWAAEKAGEARDGPVNPACRAK